MTSKIQQWRIPLKIPSVQVRIKIDISVNTSQIGMGFEADTPKNNSNMSNVCDFQTKIWLKVIDKQSKTQEARICEK